MAMMKTAPGLEKLMCPVCWSILIEPVTLPCKHHLCRACFEGSMEMANLTCPMCRKRVGAWMRQGKKGQGLVNAPLWKHIQDNYSDYIAIKQRGGDDGLNDLVKGPEPIKRLSAPGEIRKEFEETHAKLNEEVQSQHQKAEEASKRLIEMLQAEEQNAREQEEESARKREEEDEQLARELQAQMDQELKERRESIELNNAMNESSEKISAKEESTSEKPTVRGPLDFFVINKDSPQASTSTKTPKTERHPRAAKRALTPGTSSPQKKRQKTCVELFTKHAGEEERPKPPAESMSLYALLQWEVTEQERQDALLAKELHVELNKEDSNERLLRSKQHSTPTQRQPTIRETFRRKTLTDK